MSTLISYKTVQVLSPDPNVSTGPGGLCLNNNFRALADADDLKVNLSNPASSLDISSQMNMTFHVQGDSGFFFLGDSDVEAFAVDPTNVPGVIRAGIGYVFKGSLDANGGTLDNVATLNGYSSALTITGTVAIGTANISQGNFANATLTAGAAALCPLDIKAHASVQTGPLTRWYNASNTVVSQITAAGVFTGDGSGLSALNASNLATGTVGTARLGSGSATSSTYLRGDGTWATTPTGTVTSVGLSLPGIFTVSGSPVTTTGTLTAVLASQTANLVWSGPSSGSAAAPTFRSLVAADIPSLAESKITNLVSDLAAKAPLASPTFSGTVTIDTIQATGAGTMTLNGNLFFGSGGGALGGDGNISANNYYCLGQGGITADVDIGSISGFHIVGGIIVGTY